MNKKNSEDKTNSDAIKIDSVSKAFAARGVLEKVDFAIERGQSVCLCGINGAGKSTLLRIIAGLLQPDNGSVHLCGHNVNKNPEKAKSQLGVISHKSMVYPDLTVFENLLFFARIYGIKDAVARIEDQIKDVGLTMYSKTDEQISSL